jgi:hypothetical protein
VFLLDNADEGINFWTAGKENPVLEGLDNPNMAQYQAENCQSNGQQECWLRKIYPKESERSEWWIQIKTKAGLTGWTSEGKQFDGRDACG